MKVLLINGSARKNGNTAAALSLLDAFFQQKGLEVRWFQMENRPLRGCIGCNGCVGTNRCAFRDDPCNQLIEDLLWADGVVIGSPVYFAAPSGGLCALLDRAFYATCTRDQLLKGKPAAALVTCAWAGGTAAIDRLHRYFVPSQMPVITSNDYTVFQGNSLKEKESRAISVLTTLGENMYNAIKMKGEDQYETQSKTDCP